jgi:hypothetical protein
MSISRSFWQAADDRRTVRRDREQLTGFYLVDASDHDEPLAIAARIPTARFGSIEVRPIMKFS